jgi:hypothetical protein
MFKKIALSVFCCLALTSVSSAYFGKSGYLAMQYIYTANGVVSYADFRVVDYPGGPGTEHIYVYNIDKQDSKEIFNALRDAYLNHFWFTYVNNTRSDSKFYSGNDGFVSSHNKN